MSETIEIIDETMMRALILRMESFEKSVASQQTVILQLGKELRDTRMELYELKQRVLNNDSAVWTMFSGVSNEMEKIGRRPHEKTS